VPPETGLPRQAGAWLDASTEDRIDSVFSSHDRDGSPGYALGLVKEGRLVYARGYGRANLSDDVPITPRTTFHLASVSKQFTAAALALLILDGKVSLEEPVSTYVPEAGKYGSELKIKHLVYFTSGLHEYSTLPRKSGLPWQSFYYFTVDEAISASLSPEALKFRPGTRWEYSNINYMLITRIVAKASGEPFAAFMQRRVFSPLEMRHSLVNDDSTRVIPQRAIGYAPRTEAIVREASAQFGIHLQPTGGYLQLMRVSPHYGGSGVFSSIEDLAKWDAHWYSQQLAPGFTELMNTRMRFAHSKDNDAFGIVHGQFEGRPMLWFSGGDLDTSTYMARFPEQRFTIICLSNLSTGNAEGKAAEVLRILTAAGKL
jgi:CubicO group peptidase (beta-lactamase class C family)